MDRKKVATEKSKEMVKGKIRKNARAMRVTQFSILP